MRNPARDWITVVTGIPRSGTSLMMQVLEAGGIPPLTDCVRRPDPHNPRGYYELEAVKRTASDPGWLIHARGHAVKVITRLLYDLPSQHRYRALFMERPLAEVFASQQSMLRGMGRRDGLDWETFEHSFARELARARAWLARQPGFRCLRIDHRRLLEEPAPILEAVDRFLGGGLDRPAMQRAIVPSLHRQIGSQTRTPGRTRARG